LALPAYFCIMSLGLLIRLKAFPQKAVWMLPFAGIL